MRAVTSHLTARRCIYVPEDHYAYAIDQPAPEINPAAAAFVIVWLNVVLTISEPGVDSHRLTAEFDFGSKDCVSHLARLV